MSDLLKELKDIEAQHTEVVKSMQHAQQVAAQNEIQAVKLLGQIELLKKLTAPVKKEVK